VNEGKETTAPRLLRRVDDDDRIQGVREAKAASIVVREAVAGGAGTTGESVQLVRQYGSDDFRSPIVKSTKTEQWIPADRVRVLSDEEIRAMWIACVDMGAYGAVVRSALLTAQRFQKVAQMLRADLKDRVRIQGQQDNGHWVPDSDIGHVWDATRDSDPKNKRVSVVPLSRLAFAKLAELVERIVNSPTDANVVPLRR
jgi:integrase